MVALAYDFLAPSRIIFGPGRRAECGAVARKLGERAYVVSGSRHLERSGELKRLEACLESAGVSSTLLAGIHREPRVSDVDRATADLRARLEREGREGALVIGIGGGSAIDLAKAIAATATNLHLDSVRDGLEGVGRGLEIEADPLPFLALPTTAGTGSEATKNSVISSSEDEEVPFKKSLRSDRMMPDVVLIDPELAVSVPAAVTARCGLDAITQLIESIISRRARPLTTALAWHGLDHALPHLVRAVSDPDDLAAREALAHGAFLSGLCLANSGLGLAHGVAPPLGMHCEVPHGLACAVMLPAALEANRSVREAEIDEFARRLLRRDDARAEDAPDAVRELLREVGLPLTLGGLGVRREQIPALVAGSRGNSMSGNPREIGDAELTEILEGLL